MVAVVVCALAKVESFGLLSTVVAVERFVEAATAATAVAAVAAAVVVVVVGVLWLFASVFALLLAGMPTAVPNLRLLRSRSASMSMGGGAALPPVVAVAVAILV